MPNFVNFESRIIEEVIKLVHDAAQNRCPGETYTKEKAASMGCSCNDPNPKYCRTCKTMHEITYPDCWVIFAQNMIKQLLHSDLDFIFRQNIPSV